MYCSIVGILFLVVLLCSYGFALVCLFVCLILFIFGVVTGPVSGPWDKQ